MSDKAFVLIVQSGEAEGEVIAHGLSRDGHACKVVCDGDEAIESIRRRPPDVVVTADRINGSQSGLDILRTAKQQSKETEVIFTASHGDEKLARDVLAPDSPHRAFDYLIEPVNIDDLRKRVAQATRSVIRTRHHRLLREQSERAFNFGGIIGTNETLRRELKRVSKIAPTKGTVLIVGESGSGKELIAEAIHANSPRHGRPFKVLNCAALSETLLESELFGHVKGAFTGALADRKGILEAADGGTLFLDEIGDTPLPMQAKLLRSLENGEVMPVGTNEMKHVDVRFVAATHRNLLERCKDGQFREDLFYRLHAHSAIRIPPLRERREDIPLLIRHFIELANNQNDRAVEHASPEAVRKLTNYSWRGNVRELKHVIEQMVIETDDSSLDVDDLPDHIRGSTDLVPMTAPSLAGLSMADVEKLHILSTLKMTGGNRERAAAILKIGARTLYRKLKDYGIT